MRAKVVLVTGGARGIGRATAVLMADEGARLVVADVDEPSLTDLTQQLRDAGRAVESVVADVSSEDDTRTMIQTAVDAYGRLDVLVANAGVIVLGTLADTTPSDWDRIMNVDAKGMYLSCKLAVEQMQRQGDGGAIVCLSSISGVAGQRGQAAYGPAKFVASGLALHLAVELADQGIRVNAVAPGTIRTDAVRKLEEDEVGRQYVADMRAVHPMGRLGEPEEVAQAILFLASDEASFVTGHVLAVDGGYLAQ